MGMVPQGLSMWTRQAHAGRLQGTADFEGTFSADLGQERKAAERGIQRSGFAGMNSVVRYASSPTLTQQLCGASPDHCQWYQASVGHEPWQVASALGSLPDWVTVS